MAAHFVALLVDERARDVELGDEAAVVAVTHDDFDVGVLVTRRLLPAQLAVDQLVQAFGLFDRVADQVVAGLRLFALRLVVGHRIDRTAERLTPNA